MSTPQTLLNLNSIRVESLAPGVKNIILSRPSVRNAFHAEMITEITSVLNHLASISDATEMRVLVLTGEGPVFCAGADLSYMQRQAHKSYADNLSDAQNLGAMFHALASFPCPVICCVQGAAIGGGLGLVACADDVIASEDTLFATSEVRLGLVPAVISPYIVRKIGIARTSRFMLTGERMNAMEAKNCGLIQDVAPLSDKERLFSELLEAYLAAGPLACRRTKELILHSAPLPDIKTQEFTARTIACVRAGEEAAAGLDAFFSKKLPPWSGKKNL